MIECVSGDRIGGDIDYWVIQALTAIRDHSDELPKNNLEFTEEDYNKLWMPDCPFPDWLKGFAGFAYSWGGKWHGGWGRNSEKCDYVNQSYNHIININEHQKLQGIRLFNCAYDLLDIPPKSLIYCDPPYQGTTKYRTNFDSELFWEWCRQKDKEGHLVFVSEYAAPPDFHCLWARKLANNIGAERRVNIERLFTPNSAIFEREEATKLF